mgnify:CR=1 FL=1
MPEGPECTRTAKQVNRYVRGLTLVNVNIISGRYTKKLPDGFDELMSFLPLKVFKFVLGPPTLLVLVPRLVIFIFPLNFFKHSNGIFYLTSSAIMPYPYVLFRIRIITGFFC